MFHFIWLTTEKYHFILSTTKKYEHTKSTNEYEHNLIATLRLTSNSNTIKLPKDENIS